MSKLLTFVFAITLLLSSSFQTFAAQPVAKDSGNIPEKNGDYPDPDHPGVRVRVFVHEPKEKLTSGVNAVCSDPSSNAVDGTTGWKLPSSVTYRLNVSSVPSSVGATNFGTLAANAYATWQSTVSGKVMFTRGANTTVDKNALDYQNVVAFGRTSGSALAVTYTRYYTATGVVADVDTIFNKKYAWAWTNPQLNACSTNANAYDVQDILTHELGHWMGLDDEYDASYVDNTMYGYGDKGEMKKETLTTGDTTAVNSLY